MKTLIIFLFLFTALQKANSLSPTDLPETTSKTINAIYMNPMNNFGKHINICSSDRVVLQDIAGQCPYQYGTAVFQARMFLAFVDTTEYYNECENYYINNNNNQKIIHQNTDSVNDNNGFSVFPNPASDELTIINTSESAAIIEIYNYLGEKIVSKELKNYSSIISVKDLNAGIYFYKITVNNELVKADKLIVIK